MYERLANAPPNRNAPFASMASKKADASNAVEADYVLIMRNACKCAVNAKGSNLDT